MTPTPKRVRIDWREFCELFAHNYLPPGETCPDCDPCHADVLLKLANEGEG